MLTLGSLVFLTSPATCLADGGVEAEALASVRKAFAPVRRFELPNGLIGLVLEDHSAPIVSVQIWVGTGASDDVIIVGNSMKLGLRHYWHVTGAHGGALPSEVVASGPIDLTAYPTTLTAAVAMPAPGWIASRCWRTNIPFTPPTFPAMEAASRWKGIITFRNSRNS